MCGRVQRIHFIWPDSVVPQSCVLQLHRFCATKIAKESINLIIVSLFVRKTTLFAPTSSPAPVLTQRMPFFTLPQVMVIR
jgi:hypothetical protein